VLNDQTSRLEGTELLQAVDDVTRYVSRIVVFASTNTSYQCAGEDPEARQVVVRF